MQAKRIYHPREKWLRVKGAIEPIIDQDIFDSAQLLIGDTWALSNNDLLDYLTSAWCVTGYLSAGRINQAKMMPCVNTFHERFGSLANAYRMVGYKPTHVYHYTKIGHQLRLIDRNIFCQLTSNIESHGATVKYEEETQSLRINNDFTVSTAIIPYAANKFQGPGWKFFFEYRPKSDLILVVRMDKRNTAPIDYHLFPFPAFARPSFRFTDKNISRLKEYKLLSLAAFFEQCQKLRCGSDTNFTTVR